ncbi:hypothetical protein B0H13DRAFT_1856245 [Mycena leptocephala]|nr:hypothetical protein B0H13DRAFT_1856245 [Mycena leptocephala]
MGYSSVKPFPARRSSPRVSFNLTAANKRPSSPAVNLPPTLVLQTDAKTGGTMHECFVEEALALDDTKLSAPEIDSTAFQAQPKPKGASTTRSLMARLFGCSTWITANSPPVPNSPINWSFIDVTSKSHGMVLALRCPTSEEIPTMFQNRTYELFPSYQLTLELLLMCFNVPQSPNKDDSSSDPRTPRKRITKVDSAVVLTSAEASNSTTDIDMPALRSCTKADHRGSHFVHDRAELVQNAYRDA